MLWIRPLMPRPPEKLLLLVALAAFAALSGACKPKIGDDCKISTDCSAAGDRLCDITAPGGYCTMFNCEPGTCPDGESLCVEFGATRDAAEQCQDLASPSPYARSFCMQTCDNNGDCRSGYTCADLSKLPNDWDAVLIDKGRGNRACVAPYEKAEAAGDEVEGVGDVCVSKLPTPAAGGSAPTERGGSDPDPNEPGAGGQGGAGG